jgi:hypothetical protein
VKLGGSTTVAPGQIRKPPSAIGTIQRHNSALFGSAIRSTPTDSDIQSQYEALLIPQEERARQQCLANLVAFMRREIGVRGGRSPSDSRIVPYIVGDYAFIQFAGFTMGKAISQFSAPWTNYPANNFDGLVGGGGDVVGVNQLTYTSEFGQGVSATISAQDQAAYYTTNIWNTSLATPAGIVTGTYGANSIGGAWAPDLVAMLRVDQAWGLFQASFAAHDNHATYYGLTEATGHPDDKWGWAAQLALSIKNIPTGPGDTLNVQAVYTDGATRYNFQDLVPANFAMYGGTGLPGAYQSLAFAGVADTVYGAGSAQQSVTTWGFRGGFTHNWNPYWSTGIYGAYAQLNYSGAGKALVCANVIPLLVAGSTCNPDINIGQIGLITRWTPVKNLTFSADVTYSQLNQKYSGAIAIPAQASIAKPAAVYQLKDQDTVSMLIRAQRHW